MGAESGSQRTRERLLEAACEMFALKGYSDCSVSDITKLAGANKAAINYHFGSKEKLYQKAWRKEFLKAIEKYPIDGGVPLSASPEEKLKGHILAFVKRFSDPQNREFEIVKHEHVNPTGLLREVMRKSIDPIRQNLRKVVIELLGSEVPDETLQLCCLSVVSQCMDICRRRNRCGKPSNPDEAIIEAEKIANHIYRFSLAGIKEAGKQVTQQ